MDRFDPALAAIRTAQQERRTEREQVSRTLKQIDEDLRRLAVAERALDARAAAAPREETNVDTLRKIMDTRDRITQAETKAILGGPKNTARYALESLERQGVLVRTGEFVKRSPVFEKVGVAEAVATS